MANVSATARASSSGLGFSGLLTTVLIVLKLLNLITISWWWVWAPIWVPIAAVAVICLVVFFVALIAAVLESK